MIAVVQRVTEAKVVVADELAGEIGPGMVALVAVTRSDTETEAEWMAGKLAGLRIFRFGEKHFEADIAQVGGSMLLVSNFTVSAKTRRGRRPSLDAAAAPGRAEAMFNHVVACTKRLNIPVATGRFGADMRIQLVNDGPATFIVDSAALE